MHALPFIVGALATLVVAYRYYSLFLARYVAGLDDSIPTPAVQHDDGQNYHPTHPAVLFGHHFAAISGAGPLIGPVLAIQFGFLPGFLWLIIGVCLAGAVQDMLVLFASVRNDGKSLAELAHRLLGNFAGRVAGLAILFIVIIALAGLGLVVVKALGGEEIKFAANTSITSPTNANVTTIAGSDKRILQVPGASTLRYPNGSEITRSEPFTLVVPESTDVSDLKQVTIPSGSVERVKGSSWGVFTIVCTLPIALFVGLYMYKIRPGRVMEASALGAVGVLLATVAGNWIPGSPLEPWFSLSRQSTIIAICLYGFVASVLPVWILLCPRDYVSSFLKIGTIGLLVLGIVLANPRLEAPAINPVFANGGGPNFPGSIFPFVFICIMCGAISGFHALVSSGTTPKMLATERHVRAIGYGGMLMEGLVGVVALLAAASLPQSDYYAINISLDKAPAFSEKLVELGVGVDHLAEVEQQIGGESLRGRTGGAVTLAVGMAQVMTTAFQRIGISVDGMLKYWFHFAIMFEALFILTTIDTGTRIARFLLQEFLGKFYRPFEKMDWMPGVLVSSALVTLGWGAMIWSGSIDTIWPMFGIANQLLAAIALVVVTTYLVQIGKRRYIAVTLLPLAFVTTTTLTAAGQLVSSRFWGDIQTGWTGSDYGLLTKGLLNTGCIIFLLSCFLVILCLSVARWLSPKPPKTVG